MDRARAGAAANLDQQGPHLGTDRGGHHRRREPAQQTYAKELSDQVAHDRDGVTVRSGGVAMVNVQITEQSQRDLLLMESLAIPLSFLVLVWVFGGLLAAALPVAVGVMAILGALSVLRLCPSPPTCRSSRSTSPPPWAWRWPSTTRC